MIRAIKFKKLVDANNFKPELYKELVNRQVASTSEYEKGGELAILRKSLTLLVSIFKKMHPEVDFSDFEELLKYNDDVEQIKKDVKEELEKGIEVPPEPEYTQSEPVEQLSTQEAEPANSGTTEQENDIIIL